MKLEYIKEENDNYRTIRQVLNQRFKLSSNLIRRLKKEEMILLNNEFTYLDKNLNLGDKITVIIDFDEDNSNIVSTKIDLEILYEDDYFLIVNKPANMPVHPSMEHFTDSLSNGIKYYFELKGIYKKIRPVNRLDKNTSGIVIFAKNEYIQERLAYEMKSNRFIKEYIAICEGIFNEKEGIINAPIARKENSIIERCVDNKGQSSITHYKVLEEFNDMSQLLIRLETGRTHQIRVHMAHIGHSIIGDDLYGHKSNLISRQALHAYKVSFIHPILNNRIEISAEIPDDMKRIICNNKLSYK